MKWRARWQDVVLMVASFVFAPSLVISIIQGAQYPLGTTLPTFLALVAVVIADISLKLYLAAFATVLTATCWLMLIFI